MSGISPIRGNKMKEDKKKITALGLARLFAIAGKQKNEGTYEIVEDTYIDVKSEPMGVLMGVVIGDTVYLTCDDMSVRVDEEIGEINAHFRLKGEHIGFCKFWL